MARYVADFRENEQKVGLLVLQTDRIVILILALVHYYNKNIVSYGIEENVCHAVRLTTIAG